jgi:integrase
MTTFNPKQYQGKARVYRVLPKCPNVSKVYVWDDARSSYAPPARGNAFEAYRRVLKDGRRVRLKGTFATLKEALDWQAEKDAPTLIAEQSSRESTDAGPSFRLVVETDLSGPRFRRLQRTTQVAYTSKIRLYLSLLFDVPIRELTSRRIDGWIRKIADVCGDSRRQGFRHELEVLSGILRDYGDREDDSRYVFPVKRRHWEAVKPVRRRGSTPKDLTTEEFERFVTELRKLRFGAVLAPLATVQYFQALRISEAAAIRWEDVKLVREAPSRSRLLIRGKIVYTRSRGERPYWQEGFKNSEDFGPVKEQPLFPRAFDALSGMSGGEGLVFQLDGQPLEYRTIQHYYDRAFRAAKLPYRGTHVLRHGWTREVHNLFPDMEIAKQLLGDKSDQAARVYAVRRAQALTAVAEQFWRGEVVRNCSQMEGAK